jgi:hypothetical protein
MFEKAVRLKLRFSYKGVLSVEDLWDLSLRELDDIYKGVNAKLKMLSEESLLEERADKERETAELAWAIVKRVFKTKMAEQEEREAEVEKAFKKQRLLEIIADKQDEQFREMPIAELEELLSAL